MKKYLLFAILLTCPLITYASEFVQKSEFDIAQTEIKYSFSNNQITEQKFLAADSDEITYDDGSSSMRNASYKSPGKAFVMSLLVPGWGQHYNGSSKLKSLAFLGTEVASWALYFKWQGDADDLTDTYEQFNKAHWIESRYFDMLEWTYGMTDDDTAGGLYPELSHHLPSDPNDQQYFEMTGKYDQFSWGWDDAVLLSENRTFETYSLNDPMPQVNVAVNTPYSARRVQYETMRNDANNKYDQARKMIYVSMLNRLFSAFEAMIAAKNSNRNSDNGSMLTSLSAEVSMKNYYVKNDTPFLTLSMKF